MNEFLHMVVNTCHMLLDATRVMEILENDEQQSIQVDPASEHVSWRGQIIKHIEWRQVLRMEKASFHHFYVVYQLEGTSLPVMFSVDRVKGLLKLKSTDFSMLPPLPQKLNQLFDKAYYDRNLEKQILCCRSELSLEDIEWLMANNEEDTEIELVEQ